MVRILVSLVSIVLLAASCAKDDSYVIEGTLYGGKNFEDQIIYLVPFEGATPENIDSAVIHDGRFRFDGKAKEDGVYIIRMRPMMRLFIDELIVIKEPGRIHTMLSQHSSAKGTPQNDSLQSWREYKASVDSVMLDVRKQMKKATGEDLEALKRKQDTLKAQFDAHNRASISVNNNAFGEFLDKYAR